MPTKKRRSDPNSVGRGPVSLWLDRPMWDRFVKACEPVWVPASPSAFIREYLAELTPQLEELNARIEAGDREAIVELIDRTLVEGMVNLGGAASDLRSTSAEDDDSEGSA